MLLTTGYLFSGKLRFIEFGTILPILAAIFCIIRGLLYRRAYKQLQQHGVITNGAIAVKQGGYTVTFTAASGKTHTFALHAATTNDVYRQGERVEVRYNRKRPKQFTVNGGGNRATPLRYILLFLAAAALVCLAGYRMLEAF